MPILTYHRLGPDDPAETSTHGLAFVDGEPVEVPADVYERLSGNPWFSGESSADDADPGPPAPGLPEESAPRRRGRPPKAPQAGPE